MAKSATTKLLAVPSIRPRRLLPGITYPTKVVTGWGQTCIIDGSKRPFCLGSGGDSTLGANSTANYSSPQSIPNLEGEIVDMMIVVNSDLLIQDGVTNSVPWFSGNYISVCALTSFGTIKCWG